MNYNNGLRPPARRSPSRPDGMSLQQRYGSAPSNKTARLMQEQNASIPRAPRTRRDMPVDRADSYEPLNEAPAAEYFDDPVLPNEPDYIDTHDDGLTVVDLPPEFDEIPAYNEPPRAAVAPVPVPMPAANPRSRQHPEFDRGRRPAPRRSAPVPPVRKKRKRGKKNRKAARILLLVLVLLIGLTVLVSNFYSLVGGEFVSRDVTTLDVSGWDVPTTIGLSRLDKLKFLDMRGNDISIGEYNFLRKRLPDCEIVWDVPVGGGVTVCNTVSDADVSGSSGIRIGKLSKAVPYMEAIHRLDVSGCGLDGEQLLALEQNMDDLDLVWNVDVFGNDVKNDTEELILTGKSGIVLDELSQKLVSFDHLRRVELTGCGLPEKELAAFAATHPSLGCAWQIDLFGQTINSDCTELRLEATDEHPIDDLSALSSFYRLHTLYISGGTFEDLSPIAGLTTLRSLTLNKCGLSDISALSALDKLKILDLSSNSIEGLSALSGMQKLEELHLNHNSINDISPLSGLPVLRVLNLQDNKLTSTAGFGNVPCLEELSLRKNLLKGTESVDSLLSITSLKGLDMQQNKFLNKEERALTASFQEQLPDCTLYIWQ